jgi:hypothetical protein
LKDPGVRVKFLRGSGLWMDSVAKLDDKFEICAGALLINGGGGNAKSSGINSLLPGLPTSSAWVIKGISGNKKSSGVKVLF